MNAPKSNRLPALAAEIRCAHADVQDAAKAAAERAIAAGHALIEAKGLVEHGNWLPWLREHCALAARTAQLYMHIARKGVAPEIVAAVGLKGAADSIVAEWPYPSVFSEENEHHRDWRLLNLYNMLELGIHGDDTTHLCERLARWGFPSPDEYFGPEGLKWQSVCPWVSGGESELEAFRHAIERWRAFKDAHASLSIEEIDTKIAEAAAAQPEWQHPERGTRRRRKPKNATIAHLPSEGNAP